MRADRVGPRRGRVVRAPYYETQLIRAVESVLSPLGWGRTEIQHEIAKIWETNLAAFTKDEIF
jgi:DNA polymerase I